GDIDTVYINNNSKFKILLTDGSEFMTDNPRSENFKEELLMYDIDVIEESSSLQNIGIPLLLLGLLTILILYVMHKGSKQAEKEMTNMSTMEKGNHNVTINFDDVAGNEEAKRSLKQLVNFIKSPDIY